MYEKARKEQQLEKEKLQEILATLVKAKSEGAEPTQNRTKGDITVPSYRKREVALVEQQKQKNRKFFVNHYAVKFEPKEEENNTIVQVIPESHPEAITKASETNTTTSLNIAPAEHDRTFCQVGG